MIGLSSPRTKRQTKIDMSERLCAKPELPPTKHLRELYPDWLDEKTNIWHHFSRTITRTNNLY